MSKYIKPSQYAKIMGIDYRTAIKHFYRGTIAGFKDDITGTIYLENPELKTSEKTNENRVVLYARVSSTTNKASLNVQIERLENYAAAKGYTIVDKKTEIASGLNDKRPKLNRILKGDNWDILLVEHKDRLTRFGFNQIQLLLSKTGQSVEVINQDEDKDHELLDDFIAIITSFSGRIYGANRKKKTEKIIAEVRDEN